MPNAYGLPDTYKNPYSLMTPAAAMEPTTATTQTRTPTAASTTTATTGTQTRTPTTASTTTTPTTTTANPTQTVTTWLDKGWVDGDGMVTLPTGIKVTLKEAMGMYYKDRMPTADEVPPWISMNVANEFTPTYWNQLPAQMRPFVQNLYDTARQASGASRTQYPTVASMTPQAQYYG